MPFFVAGWLECKQHYVMIADSWFYTDIANNVWAIWWLRQDPRCYLSCLVAWLVPLRTALLYKLYYWVSSINFFEEEEERFAEASRLSHEIFGALKSPATISSCLWSLSPGLSREASIPPRLFTSWAGGRLKDARKSDLDRFPAEWHWLQMISHLWTSVSRSTRCVAMISPFIAWKTPPTFWPSTLSFLK